LAFLKTKSKEREHHERTRWQTRTAIGSVGQAAMKAAAESTAGYLAKR
jgi:hypothetical protein